MMGYSRLITVGITLIALATMVEAAELFNEMLVNLREQSALVDLIAYCVVIILLILIIFHLHSIDEHLNWIRRIK
jgi:CBS domain containing-hemolysin-like protein